MWLYLGLLAALFLGLHNLCKKNAVVGNEERYFQKCNLNLVIARMLFLLMDII